ncbi:MAG: class I SAM-dependent methyltransferase [Gemmatimonadetes bacterium]|uniref:Class I SAM-dependent methyltransferase n=1 Tax=Candidatus Kutchimonas denitrificans TaxID=3056748 RepID=A0AAE4Z6V1_9BACT|nr:class I SAM-dependent methyltransferase [Gemmatimonadota bacterium]NIR74434.1 class I SAM-dependent methyltransferase [Candidatus Kutchimonas denitrificans]NIS00830.1 class I SAM-dependent methyltransferase [Gemmatimonadota bacterium]NIT66453.1 class I SAM-dependent methyltransferase [Gemmatimonadota bacterium]NIU52084.1 methyltransferase domain-containing protein [Gemmatimonadota bacterium]
MAELAERSIVKGLERLRHGRLELVTPDGRRLVFGGSSGSRPRAIVRVHDPAFYRRLLLDGDVGAGESYIRGEWSSDDLVALVRLVIANAGALEAVTLLAWVGGLLGRARHWMRRNTLRGAKRNIQAHYDLSNEFFAFFLDRSMTYSCAYFERPDASLLEAQLAKYRRLAEKARLRPGEHVLEIGCGWGGFAEFAAREYGCRVTGITISREQASYARERLRRAGLDDRVRIELTDYRRLRGRFDKIMSIEMLEAVGHAYLPAFFSKVDELLAPDGIAVIQVITIPDARYERYRRRPDYIQKFVFPGSHLPSLGAMASAMADHTELLVEDLENIGPHYAETLRRWRLRFLERADAVRRLGFDDAFLRLWEFYLAYCEGGFASRYINDLQLVLTRAANPALGAGPYGRREAKTRPLADARAVSVS